MMSRRLVKKLILYRNCFVAVGNATIAWIVLIIAPLGLFAVIVCTVLIFCSSLLVGTVGDWLLVALFRTDERKRSEQHQVYYSSRRHFFQKLSQIYLNSKK